MLGSHCILPAKTQVNGEGLNNAVNLISLSLQHSQQRQQVLTAKTDPDTPDFHVQRNTTDKGDHFFFLLLLLPRSEGTRTQEEATAGRTERRDAGSDPQGDVGGPRGAGGPQRGAEEGSVSEDERGAGTALESA